LLQDFLLLQTLLEFVGNHLIRYAFGMSPEVQLSASIFPTSPIPPISATLALNWISGDTPNTYHMRPFESLRILPMGTY
jgi:hypothetical protein